MIQTKFPNNLKTDPHSSYNDEDASTHMRTTAGCILDESPLPRLNGRGHINSSVGMNTQIKSHGVKQDWAQT
jgi:hypothetical protein